ncbi:baseplate wedge protein [Arthrobacter phage Hirko]|nr:baseplate wedge protein [Arthrobacter phage Hirko]
MADGALSFPFRLTPTGSVATVVRGSDAEIDEAIAEAVLTIIGERPMRPTYGVPDPAFAGLYVGDVQVCLDEHGPQGVTIVSIDSTPINNSQEAAEITWSRGAEGN